MLKREDSLILDCIDKWYSKVTIVVSKAFIFEGEALIDSGADLNCISEGMIPSQYCSKTTQMLNTANGGRMLIEYKLSFQHIMNDIFNPYLNFIIVYIDDVVVFSKSMDQHWKHLKTFHNVVQWAGLVVSAKMIKLFQDNVRFLGRTSTMAQLLQLTGLSSLQKRFLMKSQTNNNYRDF
ncbi:hypothetical protein ACOSP7_021336 [Xanthoceras sorbifolium]